MIAHKCGVTNPEDYGLYLLLDGYGTFKNYFKMFFQWCLVFCCCCLETCLLPVEYPELVKENLKLACKPHLFAYKRHEAKIAWPKVAVSPQIGWSMFVALYL